MRHEIEVALQEENLQRETALARQQSPGEGNDGPVWSTVTMLADLDEIQRKAAQSQKRRQLGNISDVQMHGDAVVSCYRSVHRSLPLYKTDDPGLPECTQDDL